MDNVEIRMTAEHAETLGALPGVKERAPEWLAEIRRNPHGVTAYLSFTRNVHWAPRTEGRLLTFPIEPTPVQLGVLLPFNREVAEMHSKGEVKFSLSLYRPYRKREHWWQPIPLERKGYAVDPKHAELVCPEIREHLGQYPEVYLNIYNLGPKEDSRTRVLTASSQEPIDYDA